MNQNNVAIAEAYYTAFAKKNIEDMEKYLHPDVQFTGPLGEIKGKEGVLEASKKLTTLFKTLTIREKFASGDKAMLVYDIDLSASGNFPVAVLMSFQAGLITKIELFYDGRPFDRKKETIKKRRFGILKGKIKIADDFDASLSK